MIADGEGPAMAEVIVPDPVPRVNFAHRILELRQVASLYAEEAIGGVPASLLRAPLAGRILHQPAQRGGGTAALAGEPFPMARQQRHLLCFHAKGGPTAPARLLPVRGGAEIEINPPTGLVVKGEKVGAARKRLQRSHRAGDILRRAPRHHIILPG